MSAKSKKTKEKQEDVWENPEVLADQLSKTEKFINENKALVGIVLTVVVFVVVGFLGYKYYINTQNEEAQSEMYQAIFYYEQDSLEMALRGDGNYLGLVAITEDFPNTNAGNLANFYVGSIYMKQGKYELAQHYLTDFSSSDLLLQARSYSLLGDSFMEQSNFESALEYYNKAISYKANDQFTPVYIKKAAIAYEKLSDIEKAKEYYKKIIDNHKGSDLYQDAQKHFARLGGIES